jgi:DNA-binding MarR family transcriptional regulator
MIESWTEKDQRLQTGPRLRALEERLVRLESESGTAARRALRSVHLLLVDATLDGDTYTLDAALDGLRRAESVVASRSDDAENWKLMGRIETLVEGALLSLERVPSLRALADYEPESQAARCLQAIAEAPGASNEEIANVVGLGPERVSKLGRELSQRGFARKRRVGRRNSWDLTPRGTQMLQLLNSGGPTRPQREHRLAVG